MAVAAGVNRSAENDQALAQNAAQDNDNPGRGKAVPDWTENSPSYLPHLQALLAGLTEEDKDAVHASLQEA